MVLKATLSASATRSNVKRQTSGPDARRLTKLAARCQVATVISSCSDASQLAVDIGAVVHVYSKEKAYEVEFVNGEGHTVALVTLAPTDVRTMQSNEILHVRLLETA